MEKVLAIGAQTIKLQAVRPQRPFSPDAPRIAGGADGALSCTVLFVEIPDFGGLPVAEQLLCKQRLNGHVACALEGMDPAGRIVLDTQAGLAVNFLATPLDALIGLQALLANIAHATERSARLPVHGAINLGPVRVAHEANGHLNIVGDGISVAQRLLAFARDGEMLLARTFVEAILSLDAGYANLFVYQGSRTDAQVRDHEVFELDLAVLARTRLRCAASGADPARPAPAAPNRSRRWLASGFAALSLVALGAAAVGYLRDGERGTQRQAAIAVPVRTPAPAVSQPLLLDAPASTARLQATASSAVPATDAAEEASGPERAPATADTKPPRQAVGRSGHRSRQSASRSVRAATKADAQARQVAAQAAEVDAGTPAAATREPAPVQPWRNAEMAWGGTPAEAATAARTHPGAGANALITLAISPWGEVFVDGRSMGVSPPLREFELPVGRHRVVVRNGALKAYEQDLELGSNQTLRIKHKFADRG